MEHYFSFLTDGCASDRKGERSDVKHHDDDVFAGCCEGRDGPWGRPAKPAVWNDSDVRTARPWDERREMRVNPAGGGRQPAFSSGQPASQAPIGLINRHDSEREVEALRHDRMAGKHTMDRAREKIKALTPEMHNARLMEDHATVARLQRELENIKSLVHQTSLHLTEVEGKIAGFKSNGVGCVARFHEKPAISPREAAVPQEPPTTYDNAYAAPSQKRHDEALADARHPRHHHHHHHQDLQHHHHGSESGSSHGHGSPYQALQSHPHHHHSRAPSGVTAGYVERPFDLGDRLPFQEQSHVRQQSLDAHGHAKTHAHEHSHGREGHVSAGAMPPMLRPSKSLAPIAH
ncbi:hypothetical protein T484DRAFT_2938126 [Baffinella frigidus]|nr:hypothetical protein T484DRAFT_2938126 [Cryptophyta sp. CCMP2293]